MFKTSLVQGAVWHKRYTPTIHEFNYQLNSFLIDIDEPESLSKLSRLISIDKFNLYYFKPENYLRDYSGPLKLKVRQRFRQLGAQLDGTEKIFLLGQLSNLGAYFSPLNLYLCIQQDKCSQVLAEVANTPWNQRHYYLLDLTDEACIIKKDFHVSPFWDIKQNYHWQFNLTASHIFFQIDNYAAGAKVFSAGYSAQLITSERSGAIWSELIKHPWNAYKILVTIYYQALKLFIKKVPFVSHPHNHQDKE